MSSPVSGGGSRIISAEALQGVSGFTLSELDAAPHTSKPLGVRDLDNETARAAYALGRRRGYQQGLRTGQERGHTHSAAQLRALESTQAADVAARMAELIDSFSSQMAALEGQLADELVSLAIGIARQVLRRELKTDPAALLPAAAEALRTVADEATQIEIRVHPADAAVLREYLAHHAPARACSVEEDPTISHGGCRVSADTGLADATVEARWQAVMDELGRTGETAP